MDCLQLWIAKEWPLEVATRIGLRQMLVPPSEVSAAFINHSYNLGKVRGRIIRADVVVRKRELNKVRRTGPGVYAREVTIWLASRHAYEGDAAVYVEAPIARLVIPSAALELVMLSVTFEFLRERVSHLLEAARL
jgi:hypothetical protein